MLPISQIEAVAPERIHPPSAQKSPRAWHFFAVIKRIARTTRRQKTSQLWLFAFLQPKPQLLLLREGALQDPISHTRPSRPSPRSGICRFALSPRNRLPLPCDRAVGWPTFRILDLRSLSSLLPPEIAHHMRADQFPRLFARVDDELELFLKKARPLRRRRTGDLSGGQMRRHQPFCQRGGVHLGCSIERRRNLSFHSRLRGQILIEIRSYGLLALLKPVFLPAAEHGRVHASHAASHPTLPKASPP